MTSAAAEKSAPAEALLTAGTTSEYLPVELSIVTYGFSAIVGVAATVVNGPTVGSADPLGAGPQCDGGAPSTPLKTMFQTPPPHAPTVQSRENHCCCEPGTTPLLPEVPLEVRGRSYDG